MTHQEQIALRSKGHGDMHDLSAEVQRVVAASKVKVGVAHVFAIGSIWESSLPWLVVLVPLIAIGALRRRNLASAVAALLLLLAWALLCLPGFTRHHAQVDGRLRVVTHNVSWNNPDPPRLRTLSARR